MNTNFFIEKIKDLDPGALKSLAEITYDVVEGGASVGFMRPFSIDKATRFWEKVKLRVEKGEVILLVARDNVRRDIIGTVQLIIDLPENQPHRADVAKMQVLSSYRRKGVGEALLKGIELEALNAERTLLVLDTATGSAGQKLYAKAGWMEVGVVPGFALWPDGGFCSSTFFYKQLKQI